MDLHSREEMRLEVLDRIGRKNHMTDEDVYREIDQAVLQLGKAQYESLGSLGELRQDTFDSIRRFGLIEKYLRDDRVTEIMIIGPEKIFIERNGVIIRTEDAFSGEEEVRRLVDQIVAPTNRIVNESRPVADSRLPDGSRVHIVLPPVSLCGPVVTIRKFQKGGMTMEKLIDNGEFPPELAPVLSCLVRGRYSILISGATNSGKSSLLNALGEYIGSGERIITIEDSAELQLFHVDNLVRLETREANSEGMNEVSMIDLVRSSLRMRPDRVVVGEVRGAEAMTMLQALSTGHNGSFSTIHANSCRDAVRRLETMVLMGVDMPLRAVQGLIASAIDILIHLAREADGKRRLMEIVELSGFTDDSYIFNSLFKRDEPEMKEKKSGSNRLRSVGSLFHKGKLRSEGILDDYEKAMEAFRRLDNKGNYPDDR